MIITIILFFVFSIGVPIIYFSSPEVTFWEAVFSGKLWIIAIFLSVIGVLLTDKEPIEQKYNVDYDRWKSTKVCMQCSHFFK
jgi:hypothetical protein